MTSLCVDGEEFNVCVSFYLFASFERISCYTQPMLHKMETRELFALRESCTRIRKT